MSGGRKSRLLQQGKATELALLQGTESTGANAIDIFDDGVPDKPGKRMVIVYQRRLQAPMRKAWNWQAQKITSKSK